MGGTEKVAFHHSLPPKIANWEYQRPEMRLEGLPAASLPLESLSKGYRSDASAMGS